MAANDVTKTIGYLPADILSRLKRRGRKRERIGPIARRRERWFYLLISPWIIGFILFQAGPVLASGLLAFANYNLTQGITWVGFRHFASMVQDPIAIKALGNTLYFTLGSVPAGMTVAFGLANLLNQKIPGVNIFRTIFFLPAVVTGVAVVILWGLIFNPNFGLLNGLLQMIGIQGPAWLQDEHWAMPALIIMSLWDIGWIMLIYLAGLQSVPQELYEASEMDGASWVQKLRFITLPMLSPVTFFLLITNLINAFQIFTPAFVLTRGGPHNATTTFSLLIYDSAFQYNSLGYAAALAVVLFLIILSITVIQFGFARRWVHYETEVD
jgi:multiple sugar transport system permease protein